MSLLIPGRRKFTEVRSMKTLLTSAMLLLMSMVAAIGQGTSRQEATPPPPELRPIDTGFTIRGMYGFGRMRHKDATGTFADIRILEGHLGWRNTQWVYTADSTIIPGLRLSTLFYGSRTAAPGDKGTPSDGSRFGFRTAGGYGWVNPAGMILLYSASSGVWTSIDIDMLLLDTNDRGIFSDYVDARRFGSAIEAGVEIISSGGFSANIGIERNLVFPRHLVFKEALASIIQSGLADLAGNMIVRFTNSKIAGPITAFILSNAVRFAISELRSKEMNWPFTSTAPIVFDSFTIGATYTF